MDGHRYIVRDDTPHVSGLDCTADELASALRTPLANVGVRVVRQRRAVTMAAGFQARGLPRRRYEAKAGQVARIVHEVIAAIKLPESPELRQGF